MKYLYIVTVLFLSGIAWPAQGQENSAKKMQRFDQLKAEAAKSGKLILVDLYFEGCMPCIEMDKRVFPAAEIQAITQAHYLIFKSDVLQEEIGKKLARKYVVGGFPTFLIMNAEGKLIEREEGFFGIERFASLLNSAVDLQEKGIYKAFDTDLDKAYPGFYSERYLKTGSSFAPNAAQEFLGAHADIFDEVSFACMINSNIPAYNQKIYANMPALIKHYGYSFISAKITEVAKSKARDFGKDLQQDSLKQLIAHIRPTYNSRMWSIYLPILITEYYQSNKQAEEYLALIEEFQLYPTWDERSNALAQVIIDQQHNKGFLMGLLKEYEHAQQNEPHSIADNYKHALIQSYLGQNEQALAQLNKLHNLPTDDRFSPIVQADIQGLEQALQHGNLSLFKAKAAKQSIGIKMY